jgi:hypothetical protein
MKNRQQLQSTIKFLLSADRSTLTAGLYVPVICIALALNGMTSAATYVVSPNTPGTIQALINFVVQPGDIIQLEAGTYSLPDAILVDGGKSVDIRGTVDASSGNLLTILDGGGAHRVIRTYSGSSKFSRLVLQNGANGASGGNDHGGAITVGGGSPVFENCIVRRSGAGYGGGVYVANGAPVFENCLFTENNACAGGGIAVSGGSPTIRGCTVTGNTAGCGTVGGGLWSIGSPQVVNSQICGNSPNQVAGGFADLGGNCLATICGDCVDSDGDGVPDYLDRCAGGDDRDDFDGDGIPNACDCRSDLNSDGKTDGTDLGLVLALWGSSNALADINGDGIVSGADLGKLLNAWGPCTN